MREIGQEPRRELRFASDRIEGILSSILTLADEELREHVAHFIDHLEWRGFTGLNRVLEMNGQPPASAGS